MRKEILSLSSNLVRRQMFSEFGLWSGSGTGMFAAVWLPESASGRFLPIAGLAPVGYTGYECLAGITHPILIRPQPLASTYSSCTSKALDAASTKSLTGLGQLPFPAEDYKHTPPGVLMPECLPDCRTCHKQSTHTPSWDPLIQCVPLRRVPAGLAQPTVAIGFCDSGGARVQTSRLRFPRSSHEGG